MNKAARIIDNNKNNDFDVIAKLKKAGYRYEMKNLIDTITESTYELKVFNEEDKLKAKAVFKSEEGIGTMLADLDWY